MDPRQFEIQYGGEEKPYQGDGGWTSYHTVPDVVSEMAKLWYGRLISDPVRSMGNVGAGIIGNVPQVKIDDSTDLRKVGGQYVAQGGTGGIGDIMNALLLYGGPGIATGKPGMASAGVFAGEKALGANLAMKQIAEKALAAGKDPDEVRRITGWFKGMEGMPKFEIGDQAMGLQPSFAEQLKPQSGMTGFYKAPKAEMTLPEVIDHPVLFESYPELKNTKVVFDKGEGAAFDPENNVIHLQKSGVNMGLQNTWLDSVSHEIQHWVQQKEGFARGGNVGSYMEQKFVVPDEKYKMAQSMYAYALGLEKGEDKGFLSRVFGSLGEKQKVEAERIGPKGLEKWIRENDPNKGRLGPISYYDNLAGEIEARDVSTRRTWDAEMREAVPPDLRKDAIIRWGGKESEEIFQELVK